MLTPAALADALQTRTLQDIPPLPGRRNHLRAGVLVPLLWRRGDPVVLATLRSATLREHAGEVAFPGGKRSPEDRDFSETALREAHEEIGLLPDDAQLLGPLSAIPLYTSDYRLMPFVAAVPDRTYAPQPGEVDRVLELNLAAVFDAEVLDGVPWSFQGRTHMSPVFDFDGELMYGGTAHSLHELLQVMAAAMGRPLPPWRAGRFAWSGRGVVRADAEDGGQPERGEP